MRTFDLQTITPHDNATHRIRMFREIAAILDMEPGQGLLSCKIVEDVFVCISISDVTEITLRIYDAYLSFKSMERITNVTDLVSIANEESNLKMNIDRMLFIKCIETVAGKVTTDNYQALLATAIKSNSASALERFLTNIQGASTIITSDYILNVWCPYVSNISGFAVYQNLTSQNAFYFEEIHMNETFESIDYSNLKVAGNVPYQFLNDTTYYLSNEKKEELRVVMLIVLNNTKFLELPEEIENFIGIAIPGFCKRNYFPIMKVFFASLISPDYDRWFDVGSSYFDLFDYDDYACVLSKMSYFGYANSQKFESVRKERCLVSASDIESSSNISWLVPSNALIFAPQLCVDVYFEIKHMSCLPDVSENYYVDFDCLNDDVFSKHTDTLYGRFVSCNYRKRNCFIHSTDFNDRPFDILLQSKMLALGTITFTSQLPSLLKLLDRSLDLIRNRALNIDAMSFIGVLVEAFRFPEEVIPFEWKGEHYGIWVKSNIKGFITSAKETRPISEFDDFIDQDYDLNINGIILLENHSVSDLTMTAIVMDFVPNYFEKGEHCISNIIAIRYTCDWCTGELEFSIFLRILENGSSSKNGYWYDIQLKKEIFTIICISKWYDNGCSMDTDLLIFEKNPEIGKETKIMILPTSMSISRFLAKFSYNHHENLKALSNIVATLSVLGLFIIISFKALTNWSGKEYYAIQIYVSLLFQLLPRYFVLDEYVSYSLFYYGYISEFIWILILIYTKYVKFVRLPCKPKRFFINCIGWLSPFLTLVIYHTLLDVSCWKCNNCYDGINLGIQFLFVPTALLYISNLTVYSIVMGKIYCTKLAARSNIRKAKARAAIILPIFSAFFFVFGFLIIPDLWLIIKILLYVYYIVTPSQGFLLFVFIVIDLVRKNIYNWLCGLILIVKNVLKK